MSDYKNMLLTACVDGDIGIVENCISKGVDVNAMGRYGWNTALILASHFGNPEIVVILLEEGADRSAMDVNKQTARDNALSQHEFKIVEILDKWEAKNG